MLINNYQERCERAKNKKQIVLEFLREETWTSPQIIALLIQLTMGSSYKILNRLKKEGLVTSHFVEDLKLTIWGITTLGLLESWDGSELEPQNRNYFQPSRVRAVMINHHLMLQHARLQAQNNGWTNWIPGHLLPKNIDKRPDAVAMSALGQIISIEVERHMKTKKRYEAIISLYLQKIKRKEYDEVHYVVPSVKFARSLKRLFRLITHIPVQGEHVKLEERHLSKFIIAKIDDWPIKLE